MFGGIIEATIGIEGLTGNMRSNNLSNETNPINRKSIGVAD